MFEENKDYREMWELQKKNSRKKARRSLLPVVSGALAGVVLTVAVLLSGMITWPGSDNNLLHNILGSSTASADIGTINQSNTELQNSQSSETNDVQATSKLETLELATGGNLTIAQIYKKVSPSIVGIKTTFQASINNGFFSTGTGEQSGEGSGIIIRKDGYIMTNFHVVSEAVDTSAKKLTSGSKIEVYLPGNTSTGYNASLVGYDKSTDLAVLKIEKTGLPIAEMGDSDKLTIGDLAVAIGNPGGMEYMSSVTAGIISGLNRTVSSDGYKNMKLIQTDAAINPGNSGGALINSKGQVVGVNSIKIAADAFEGLGFAIPINEAMDISNNLINYKYVPGRPYLGISAYEQYTRQVAQQYNMPEGVLVYTVDASGPAGKAGVKVEDIIVKADGKEVVDFDGLEKIKNTHKPGETMTLQVYRNWNTRGVAGTYVTVTVTLGEATY